MDQADRWRAYRKMADEAHATLMSFVDSIIVDLIPSPFVLLPVPWLSQLGPDADYAPGDCGPACLAMWLRHLGHTAVTVDDVSEASGRPPGYHFTTPTHLAYTADEWDVNLYWARNMTLDDLRAELDAGQPIIVLVHYGSLLWRYDQKYKKGHWLLVVGYTNENFVYLDPYWPGAEQGTVAIPQVDFLAAWSANHLDGNSDRQGLRLW